MNRLKIKTIGDTHVGQRRTNNEDNLLLGRDLVQKDWSLASSKIVEVSELGTLLVVADGMGGAAAGDVASTLAVNRIKEIFSDVNALPEDDDSILEFLGNVIFNAHHTVVNGSVEHPERQGMGTTLVIGLIVGIKLYLAWSGDSRAYRFSKDGVPAKNSYDTDHLELLTSDHSMVWEMVEKGKITAEQARVHPNSNIITQSLGDPMHTPAPDGRIIQLRKGDRVLLCSDGLNSMLPDFEIESILSTVNETAETCEKLIWLANNAGGADNITVIVADIIDGPAGFITDNGEEQKQAPKKRKSITTKQVLIDENKKVKKESQGIKIMPALLTFLLFGLVGLGIWQFDNISNAISAKETAPAKKKVVEVPVPTNEFLKEKAAAKRQVLLVDSLRSISYGEFANASQIDNLFSAFDLQNRNTQLAFANTQNTTQVTNELNALTEIKNKLVVEFANPTYTKSEGDEIIKTPPIKPEPISKYSMNIPNWAKEYKTVLNRKVKVCQAFNQMTLEDKSELNVLLQKCETLTDKFYEVYNWKTALFSNNDTEVLKENYGAISQGVKEIEVGLNKLTQQLATENKAEKSIEEKDTVSKEKAKEILTDSSKTEIQIEKDTSNQNNN